MPRRGKTTKVDPIVAAIAAERAKVEAEKAAAEAVAEAKAAAEKAAADAEILKKRKALCGYLIIFCLHYHGCSVRNILYVLQCYDIASTERRIADCIKDNKLLTLHEVLPDDEGEQSVFKIDETASLSAEGHDSKHYKLKMTHPELPTIQSAGQVLTQTPEGHRITVIAARKLIIFNIMSLENPYSLKPLFPHFMRCMQRAVGVEFPPSVFLALPPAFR